MEPAIIVALISTAMTRVPTRLNNGKYTKTEAVTLERRLTKLEESSDKVDLLYDTLVTKGLQLLMSPHTPGLDTLMKAALNGLEYLSTEDAQLLVEGLNREFIANPAVDAGKRLVATLIEAVVKKEKELAV